MFGCSNYSLELGFDPNKDNTISGILRMDLSLVSLVNQLPTEVIEHFSYCLDLGNSYIRFCDVVLSGRNFSSTTFRNPKLPNYNLNLSDISMGSLRLGLSKGFFTLKTH